jgi:hypothetical protein
LESFLPIGCRALLFVEKIRQSDAQFWFALRTVGFLQIFYSQAAIPRAIVDFPAFLEHGSAEKIAVCAHGGHTLHCRYHGTKPIFALYSLHATKKVLVLFLNALQKREYSARISTCDRIVVVYFGRLCSAADSCTLHSSPASAIVVVKFPSLCKRL